MGGDEYSVLLRDVEDKKVISSVVEKIHMTVQEEMRIGDNVCHVSSSIGVAIYPENGLDSETLLRNADSKMYGVKEMVRVVSALFNDEYRDTHSSRLEYY